MTQEEQEKHARTLEEAQSLLSQGWTFEGVEYVLRRNIPPGAKDPVQQKPQAQPNVFTLKVDPPVLESEVPFSSFYVGRILKSFKEKHGITWTFSKEANGAITSISFTGPANEEQKKELESTLDWAVKKVLERRKGTK